MDIMDKKEISLYFSFSVHLHRKIIIIHLPLHPPKTVKNVALRKKENPKHLMKFISCAIS